MNLLLIILVSFVHAGPPVPNKPMTESMKQCIQDAKDKNAILKASQCKWRLPITNGTPGDDISPDNIKSTDATNVGVVGNARNKTFERDPIKGKNVKRKTTYEDGEHHGVLDCNNSTNAIATSYVDRQPVFVYQSSECVTSDPSEDLKDTCMQSMFEGETNACINGDPKIKQNPKTGCLLDENGGDTSIDCDKNSTDQKVLH